MREFSVPATTEVGPDEALTDLLAENVAEVGDQTGFRVRRDGAWQDVTWKEFGDQVAGVAKGLIASGVAAGDRVALQAKTRYEWAVIDFAIWTAGAVTVPIYETSSADQVAWILSDSGATAVIVERDEHATAVESVRDQAPDLKSVHVIEDDAVGTLTQAGKDVPDSELEARRKTLKADSVATLIYTSGTTGRPKGCELTHSNFLFEIGNGMSLLGRFLNVEGSILLFIPLAHVLARVIHVGAVKTRTVVGHTPDVKDLVADLGAFKPTFVLAVPRVFEKVFNTAKGKAEADGKGKIFDKAAQVAIDWSRALDKGGPGILLKAQHALFDKLVYGKLRAALGGRCLGAISGGAPLGDRLGHFYRGIGVTVYEGYGLTETTAAASVNHDDGAAHRHRRPPPARRGLRDRRRRRGAHPRRHRDARLLEERGRHQGGDRLRRLVPHRRPRRARRRRLPEDHRPQEGDPGDGGRQERGPRGARGPAARPRPDQPVHRRRRPAAVHRGADHPRRGGAAAVAGVQGQAQGPDPRAGPGGPGAATRRSSRP